MNRAAHCMIMACAMLALGGCASLAPHYERRAAPVPAQWPSGASYAPTQDGAAADARAAIELPWRQFILEPRLQAIIAQALDQSRTLRQSIASIEAARAQYGVQRAEQFPAIGAALDGSRARTNSNGNSAISQNVSATLGVSAFELDLFGRVRSLSDAALESYLATEEAARAVRITLIADTANAWLALAAEQSRLATARQTLASAQRTLELTRRRKDVGVASGVDVSGAETTYQQARADVASYTTAVAQQRNALELLAGAPLDDALLPAELLPVAVWLAPVPAGLSSAVLLERPDVLQAEHQLQSANADIGAARAAFFPRISLTGTGGSASTALSSLFGAGSRVWSFAPSISLPIFDGGANRAALAYAEAQRESLVAAYELAVQTAFKEVADALAAQGTLAEQVAAQTDLVAAAADSNRLAEARYSRGVDTFLAALVAQRTLYASQQSLIDAQLDSLQNRVTLYRALGGGLAGPTDASPSTSP